MTLEEYRRVALARPEAVESSHMNHPDFRIRGKIFATIPSVGKDQGMVKLTPDQQKKFAQEYPKVFSPVPGGWGRRGATLVKLAPATKEMVTRAMQCAWRNVAPKRLNAEIDGKS